MSQDTLGGEDSLGEGASSGAIGAVSSTRAINAGSGLTGGGDLSADRTISMPNVGPGAGVIGTSGISTFTLDAQGRVTAATALALTPQSRTLTAGAGLSGGGDFSANRTVSMPATGPGAVTSGGTGLSSITTDAQGRVTAVAAMAVLLVNEIPSRASADQVALDSVSVPTQTITVTGNTPINTTGGFNFVKFAAPTLSNAQTLVIGGTSTVFIEGPPVLAGAAPATATNLNALRVSGTWVNATLTGHGIRVTPTYAPVSGTGVFNAISLDYTVNQTGGANGTVRGVYINATETAVGGINNLIDAQIATTSVFQVMGGGSSTLLKVLASKTVASATSAAWDGINVAPATLTLTGNTAVTTSAGVNAVTFGTPTITAGSAVAVTNAATVTILGAPVAGGSTTIANPYALWVQSGRVRFATTSASAPSVFGDPLLAGTGFTEQVEIGSTTGTSSLRIGQGASNNMGFSWVFNATPGNAKAQLNTFGFTNPLEVDASEVRLQPNTTKNVLVGPSFADVASTVLRVNTSKTVASATSAVWNGFEVATPTLTLSGNTAITTATGVNMAVFGAPTITAASALAVSDAATVVIAGAPTGAGAGPATITRKYALWVPSGAVKFGNIALDTAYGFDICDSGLGSLKWGGTTIKAALSYSGGGFASVGTTTAHHLAFFANNLEVARGTTNQNLLIATTTDVASTVLRVNAAKTIASASGAVWDGIDTIASTATISGVTNITTATGFNMVVFRQPTLSAGSALTVSFASTVYIAAAPAAAGAGPATITKAYSLWIDAGLPRIDSTTANGSVVTVLGSVGPVGSNTTVQEWLTVDINGNTRYIPCF